MKARRLVFAVEMDSASRISDLKAWLTKYLVQDGYATKVHQIQANVMQAKAGKKAKKR